MTKGRVKPSRRDDRERQGGDGHEVAAQGERVAEHAPEMAAHAPGVEHLAAVAPDQRRAPGRADHARAGTRAGSPGSVPPMTFTIGRHDDHERHVAEEEEGARAGSRRRAARPGPCERRSCGRPRGPRPGCDVVMRAARGRKEPEGAGHELVELVMQHEARMGVPSAPDLAPTGARLRAAARPGRSWRGGARRPASHSDAK